MLMIMIMTRKELIATRSQLCSCSLTFARVPNADPRVWLEEVVLFLKIRLLPLGKTVEDLSAHPKYLRTRTYTNAGDTVLPHTVMKSASERYMSLVVGSTPGGYGIVVSCSMVYCTDAMPSNAPRPDAGAGAGLVEDEAGTGGGPRGAEAFGGGDGTVDAGGCCGMLGGGGRGGDACACVSCV
jgi:hypothetical protein